MSTDVAMFQEDRAKIATYLGLNPNDPKSHAVIAVCNRYALDPVLKHVVVIPKGGVYITRDGLLHVAHRSGQLDGIEVDEEGENDQEWWCRVSVYRKDMGRPFRYKGRYSKKAQNAAYGPEMALKCAEALALRRAFDVTGIPVLEEREAAPVSAARLIPTTAPTEEPTPEHPVPEGVDPETGEIIEDAELVEDEPAITGPQRKALFAELKRVGMATKDDGLGLLTELLGRPVDSTEHLTQAEASQLLDELGALPDADPEDAA